MIYDDLKQFGVSLPARILDWGDYSGEYRTLMGLGETEIPSDLVLMYEGQLARIAKYIGPVGANPLDYRLGFVPEARRAASLRRLIGIRMLNTESFDLARKDPSQVEQLQKTLTEADINLYRETQVIEADIRDTSGAVGTEARKVYLAKDVAESIKRGEVAAKWESVVAPIETAEGVAKAVGAGVQAVGAGVLTTAKLSKYLIPIAAIAAGVLLLGRLKK